jgi:hypothetical protein
MKAPSFLTRLFQNPAASAAIDEAAKLAIALDNYPKLGRWLITGIAASPRESAELLTRAAQTLRDEMREFVIASILERLAHDPLLLKALIRHLRRIERSTFRGCNPSREPAAFTSVTA